MKKFASLIVLTLLISTAGLTSAAQVSVSDPFPEGTVLNPASSEETIVFGDVQATIISNEFDEDGNRTLTLQIENNLRTALWIEPTYLLIFGEGRYLGDARVDEGAASFSIVSMETETGTADIAYEWFMSIDAGGTGVVTMSIGADAEKLCYKPFASNMSGLLDDEDTRIHGCWLLEADSQE